MRYEPEHKAEVHRKIVKDASRRVRAEGLSGAGVAAVMRDAGLSHGGFYKHFANKDALLAESLGEAFQDIGDQLVRAAAGARQGAAWKAIVQFYLSVEFCDHAERGCPLTALAPELARLDAGMRRRVLGALVGYRDRLVPMMPGRGAAAKERAFFVIFSTMAGAVALARLLPEPAAREKVLSSAREFLLRSF
jgi:TetR/AcrR family transcriptional repressor of nem operon